jgi:hypothetical protein
MGFVQRLLESSKARFPPSPLVDRLLMKGRVRPVAGAGPRIG